MSYTLVQYDLLKRKITVYKVPFIHLKIDPRKDFFYSAVKRVHAPLRVLYEVRCQV